MFSNKDSKELSSSKQHVKVLEKTLLLSHLHTIIRDKDTNMTDFVNASNLIIHRLIDESLSILPSTSITVNTPCGEYTGDKISFDTICAVSVVRAGDAMLHVLRNILPSATCGKILIQRNESTAEPILFHSKLPADIKDKWILLLDPMLATGGSAVKAIDVLREHGVAENKIIFVNLVAVNEGIAFLHSKYPTVKIVTSEIDAILNEKKYIVPGLGDFGDRYFGTV